MTGPQPSIWRDNLGMGQVENYVVGLLGKFLECPDVRHALTEHWAIPVNAADE